MFTRSDAYRAAFEAAKNEVLEVMKRVEGEIKFAAAGGELHVEIELPAKLCSFVCDILADHEYAVTASMPTIYDTPSVTMTIGPYALAPQKEGVAQLVVSWHRFDHRRAND